jgi:hypothetical protein
LNCLQARIEVDRTDPENRPFRHCDPIGWTEANRAKILQALYTVLLGNPELSKPRNAPAKTRFKLWWRVVGSAIEHAAKCNNHEVDFQQLFLDQETDEEDSASLADALMVLDSRFPVGTFKAADVANLINANGNTSDGVAVREFLFPGGRIDQTVSTKAVAKRLSAHVGNPVGHGEKTLSLCSGYDSHSKTLTFFVKVTAS